MDDGAGDGVIEGPVSPDTDEANGLGDWAFAHAAMMTPRRRTIGRRMCTIPRHAGDDASETSQWRRCYEPFRGGRTGVGRQPVLSERATLRTIAGKPVSPTGAVAPIETTSPVGRSAMYSMVWLGVPMSAALRRVVQ